MTTIGSRYRGTKKYLVVYARLINAALNRNLVYYEELAALIGITQTGYHMAREVGQGLGEVSEDEDKAGRPMLSAVAIGTKGYPGEGFFHLAKELRGYSGGTSHEEKAFCASKRDRVYDEWAST